MSKELLNEMKKFIRITEGAWSLPESDEDYKKLAEILSKQLPADDLKTELYSVLGDDSLFDILDQLPGSDSENASQAVIDWMQTQSRNPDSNHPMIWDEYVRVNGAAPKVSEKLECGCLDECSCAPVKEETNDFMHEIQLESVVEDVLNEGPNLKNLVSKYQDDEGEFDIDALSDMLDDEPTAPPAKKVGDDEDLDGLRFA